ncbi:MAG: Spx/MgsR family RNA polymerase-binding regulatory protein [Thiovulaceae bacterium]|nr:Spx/MgsR family RNA polymerase-binding regulatory protein [Sulfurimonadaceae bacterium]
MITIHGIKNCDSVKKALKFLQENEIEYSFRDFKTSQVDSDEIKMWLKHTTIDKLFNSKSTTYRKLNLKELTLSDDEKIAWLCKENLLIKRPVLQSKSAIIIGYDKDHYEMELL